MVEQLVKQQLNTVNDDDVDNNDAIQVANPNLNADYSDDANPNDLKST